MVGRSLVILGAVALLATSVQAQTLEEGEIVAVPPKSVLVQNRLELVPRFGVTFNDPLISQFGVGGSLNFHITERYSIGGTFEWYDFGSGFGGTTEAYDEVIRAGSVIPEIAPLTYFASADFGWIFVNGKFSLFDVAIVYYDFYALGGLGVIDTVGDPHVAGTLGLGQRTFFNKWLALVIELRDRAYVEPLPSGNSFTNILTVAFGLSVFVPPSFDYSAREERILDWD